MGLDYSYLLYFKRSDCWKALQAVAKISVPHLPSTRVLFPNHELEIPLETWVWNDGKLNANDPELGFQIVIYFEEDEAIQTYLSFRRRNEGLEDHFRSPPMGDEPIKVPIGWVYLTISTESSQLYAGKSEEDTVAFNFGTTGTRMSLLFYESTSIRQKFVEILALVPGVCGVFNREEDGELFWYQGRSLSVEIPDPFLLPVEIERFFGSNEWKLTE